MSPVLVEIFNDNKDAVPFSRWTVIDILGTMDTKVQTICNNRPLHACPSDYNLLAFLSSFTQFLYQRFLKLLQLLWADTQQAAHVTDQNPRPGVILAWEDSNV